jgi:hypothetical protein
MQGKDEKILDLECMVDEEYKGHTQFSRLIHASQLIDIAPLEERQESHGGTSPCCADVGDTSIRVRRLEKALETRETEIHHLENMLHQHPPSAPTSNPSSSNPYSRIIHLEEHIRTLESVFPHFPPNSQ